MQQDEDLPGLAQGVATKTNVPKIDSPRRNKDDPVIKHSTGKFIIYS